MRLIQLGDAIQDFLRQSLLLLASKVSRSNEGLIECDDNHGANLPEKRLEGYPVRSSNLDPGSAIGCAGDRPG